MKKIFTIFIIALFCGNTIYGHNGYESINQYERNNNINVLGVNLKANEKEQDNSIKDYSDLIESIHYSDFKFCGFNFNSATIEIEKNTIKEGIFCSKGYATKNGALLLLENLKKKLSGLFLFKESQFRDLIKNNEIYSDSVYSKNVGRIYIFKNSYDEYMLGILLKGNICVEKTNILKLISEETEVTKTRSFKNVQLENFNFSSVEFSMKDNETNIGSFTRCFDNFADAKKFRDDLAGCLEQNYYLNTVMDGKIKSYQAYVNNDSEDYVFTIYIEAHSKSDYRVVLFNNPWYDASSI